MGSEFFLSILCSTKRSILSYTIFLKSYLISSTLLPLLANITNLSRRRLLSLRHKFCFISGLPFVPGVHCTCPPIPLPESPHNGHWPPVLYRLMLLKFWVGPNKRPVKHTHVLGYLLTDCQRFPIPNYLYVGCVVSSHTQ